MRVVEPSPDVAREVMDNRAVRELPDPFVEILVDGRLRISHRRSGIRSICQIHRSAYRDASVVISVCGALRASSAHIPGSGGISRPVDPVSGYVVGDLFPEGYGKRMSSCERFSVRIDQL